MCGEDRAQCYGPTKTALRFPKDGPLTFTQHLESAGLHGFAGGLISVAQGGKFGSGFIAAGFSDLAGGYLHLGNLPSDTVIHAIIGGAAAELGGGKLANGAVTAAFGYLYNTVASKRWMSLSVVNGVLTGTIKVSCGDTGSKCDDLMSDMQNVNNSVNVNVKIEKYNEGCLFCGGPDVILRGVPDWGNEGCGDDLACYLSGTKYIEFDTNRWKKIIGSNVAAHELFHLLGLPDQVTNPNSIMYKYYPQGNILAPEESQSLIGMWE